MRRVITFVCSLLLFAFGAKSAAPKEALEAKATVCAEKELPVPGLLHAMCLDLELAGGDTCNRELDLTLRFNTSSSDIIMQQPLNLTGEGTCVNSTVLQQVAPVLTVACGADVKVSVCLCG